MNRLLIALMLPVTLFLTNCGSMDDAFNTADNNDVIAKAIDSSAAPTDLNLKGNVSDSWHYGWYPYNYALYYGGFAYPYTYNPYGHYYSFGYPLTWGYRLLPSYYPATTCAAPCAYGPGTTPSVGGPAFGGRMPFGHRGMMKGPMMDRDGDGRPDAAPQGAPAGGADQGGMPAQAGEQQGGMPAQGGDQQGGMPAQAGEQGGAAGMGEQQGGGAPQGGAGDAGDQGQQPAGDQGQQTGGQTA